MYLRRALGMEEALTESRGYVLYTSAGQQRADLCAVEGLREQYEMRRVEQRSARISFVEDICELLHDRSGLHFVSTRLLHHGAHDTHPLPHAE